MDRNFIEGRCYIPRRYVFLFLGFFGFFNLLATRVNLSMTMVAMVNSSTDHHSDDLQTISECPDLNQTRELEAIKGIGVKYNWDANMQGLILAAIFYGMILTPLPGAVLSERCGAKWIIGGAVLLSAVMTLLTPLAASWGVYPLVILRFLQGLAHGVMFPAIHMMVAKWSHKFERSRFISIIFSGYHIGIVVSMAFTGWLSGINILGGWPSTFYVFGISGCLWFVFWATLVYERPSQHPNISDAELNYLESSNEVPKEKLSTPWKAILTSVPVWVVLIADVGSQFALILFMTEIPTYLSNVLHFNILHDGLLMALCFILQTVFSLFASYIADSLRKSNRLSITNIRKLFTSLALFGPAVCLLGVTLSGCHLELTIGLIILSRAINGFIYPGVCPVPIDLSPAFAGTINGIIYVFNGLCGILTPSIVSAITVNSATIAQWNCVFYIAIAIQVISGLIFIAFSSAELQTWGTGDVDSSRIESKPDEIPSSGAFILKIRSSTRVIETGTGPMKQDRSS